MEKIVLLIAAHQDKIKELEKRLKELELIVKWRIASFVTRLRKLNGFLRKQK